ncbi:LytTR family DNA-binding domain-containing protein [Epibacterium ulvae]|uniref:LytTR family DNA-binding domain-containing protein n=1 Tax=Epibacterium ulvae TaxID=1156985 RepID=UPI002492719C|nr:LytTR family DNA-binding domain-containing protein [Epibacterium ulvae]
MLSCRDVTGERTEVRIKHVFKVIFCRWSLVNFFFFVLIAVWLSPFSYQIDTSILVNFLVTVTVCATAVGFFFLWWRILIHFLPPGFSIPSVLISFLSSATGIAIFDRIMFYAMNDPLMTVTEFSLKLLFSAILVEAWFLFLITFVLPMFHHQFSFSSSSRKSQEASQDIKKTVKTNSMHEELLPLGNRGILLREVIKIEAQNVYVEVTTLQEVALFRSKFSTVLEKLPKHAGICVHRSHWIGKSHIEDTSFADGKLMLVLSTGEEYSVARSRQSEVKSWLRKFRPEL